MSVLPSFGLPRPPRREPFHVGRPPRANDVQALQDVANHIEDWRFRQWTRALVEVDASACPATVSGSSSTPHVGPGPHNLTEVTRIPHYTRTDARHLWVAICYQAANEGTSSPVIDVQLYTLGGVLRDRGIRFETAAGTLETSRQFDHPLYLATGGTDLYVYPHLWISTGTRVDDEARTAASPGDPRLLSLAGASPRTRLEVRVTATAARVLSVNIWEFPEALL